MSPGKYGVIPSYLFFFFVAMPYACLVAYQPREQGASVFYKKNKRPINLALSYWHLTFLVLDDTVSIRCFSLPYNVLCLVYILNENWP